MLYNLFYPHLARLFLAMKNCRWFRVEKAIQCIPYRIFNVVPVRKLYVIIFLVTEEGVLNQSPAARQI